MHRLPNDVSRCANDGCQLRVNCLRWLNLSAWSDSSEAGLRNQLILSRWDVEQASLYDEEGVEGWTWTSPDGTEYSEVGSHDEPPPIPDQALKFLADQAKVETFDSIVVSIFNQNEDGTCDDQIEP